MAALRFGMDGDAEGLHRQLGAMGFFDPADEEVTPEAVSSTSTTSRAGTSRTAS